MYILGETKACLASYASINALIWELIPKDWHLSDFVRVGIEEGILCWVLYYLKERMHKLKVYKQFFGLVRLGFHVIIGFYKVLSNTDFSKSALLLGFLTIF